jgi:hypothetical protein
MALVAAPGRKLTVEDLMNLLSAGVSVPRVTTLVRERGVDFQLTARYQRAFVEAGADQTLMRALEEQAGPGKTGGAPPTSAGTLPHPEASSALSITPVTPKPALSTSPAPPGLPTKETATLQIRSAPGGATVWVDNELKGVTDLNEGRLEISGLRPGKRQLRAERDGFDPVEGTVELAAGQATEMPLWLSKSAAPPPAPSAPELPPGRKFLVRHKHRAIEGIAPEGSCQGWMIVNVGYLRYISTDSPHKYLMNTSEMREAKASSGQGNFRIKLDFGRTYEFAAVDEKGNAINAAAVLTEIRYSMGE